MNMGKKITDLREVEEIPGGSSYIVEMGDGTGTKKVTHNHLVNQLLTDMEMPYDETLAMLRAADENGDQKIPNVKAISDWIASKITNNLLATEEGFFLDARLGPIIDTRFKAVEDRVTQINSDLDAVTHILAIDNPSSKEDILQRTYLSKERFYKSNIVPARIFMNPSYDNSIPSGNYLGYLTQAAGCLCGILINNWDPSQKLSIAMTLYDPLNIAVKPE